MVYYSGPKSEKFELNETNSVPKTKGKGSKPGILKQKSLTNERSATSTSILVYSFSTQKTLKSIKVSHLALSSIGCTNNSSYSIGNNRNNSEND